MSTNTIRPGQENGSATLPSQNTSSPRILVVEDDETIRDLNSQVLRSAGYHVDAAEDGASAWDTLQRNNYDIVVTDNNMPNVTGVELIEKIHAAKLPVPVIMVSGTFPEEEFARTPGLTPAAVLLKPYTFEALLGTVKTLLQASVPILMFWFLSGTVQAQETTPASGTSLQAPNNVDRPQAVTIAVRGTCEYSADGVTFSTLEKTQILNQGAVVRTGDNGRVDLFFHRTGTTVRLQAGTEIKIEKMTLTMNDGLPVEDTLLDLRSGRIFTVVQSTVAGSTLEIRNAAGRSVVEGSGVGRYIITADGTHVAATGSVIPLKVIGENGITIVAAGQQFSKKDGKMLPASPTLWVKDMMELDELNASTEAADAKDPSPTK